MTLGGSHLVIRGAEEIIARGVEAQPRDRALVGTDDLHAGGVGDRPDADGGIGRSREHQILKRNEAEMLLTHTKNVISPSEGGFDRPSTRNGPRKANLVVMEETKRWAKRT